jgi:hypothetical protein
MIKLNHIASAFFFVLALSFLAQKSVAQEGAIRPGELSPELDSLLILGQFDRLEIEALRMLLPGDQADPLDLVAAHLYLGFNFVLKGQTNEAKSEFHQALEIQPSLALDKVYVPPRLYNEFESVRLQFLRNRQRFAIQRQQVRLERNTSTFGTIVNLILPGAGYFAARQNELRGIVWTGLFAGSSAILLDSYMKMDDAHKKYQTEANPLKIKQKYDKYNEFYQQTRILAGSVVAIYIGAQLDYQVKGVRIISTPVVLGPPENTTLGMRITFTR